MRDTSRTSNSEALGVVPAEDLVHEFLRRSEDDWTREGLRETPKRVVAAWQHWLSGYNQDPAKVLKVFNDGAERYDSFVFQGSIPVWSTCEHHLAPFFGLAHVGYIPQGKVVGLSKLTRVVDIFARRLTIQERIATETADALMKHLDPLGVGVILQCRHSCMESRGVQKIGTITVTSALRGCIKDDADARAEFMSMVQSATIGLRSL